MDTEQLSATEAVQKSGISEHVTRMIANDLIMGDDGYYVFWPASGCGGFRPWTLRLIADILDEINRPWDDDVNEYFNERQNSSY